MSSIQGLKSHIVKSKTEFKELRSEWNDLLKNSYTDSLFLTWEWLYSWWSAYSGGKTLNIICVRIDSKLAGIAPLFIHRNKYYKVSVNEITFLGDEASDRQDFIVDKNYPEVYSALIDQIYKSKTWDIARFEQIPAWSSLVSFKQSDKKYQKEPSSKLPFILIRSDWETYYKGLSKKVKKNYKYSSNSIGKLGEWKVIHLSNPTNLERELAHVFNLEIESKKGDAGYALFSDEKAQHFHKSFSSYCAQKGWLNITLLILNGKPISYLIGYIYNNTYLAYNTAYDQEFYRLSPGKLIFHAMVRYAFESRLNELDFLRGDSYLKKIWTSEKRINYRIVIFNRTLKAEILNIVVFKIRPSLKKLFNKD